MKPFTARLAGLTVLILASSVPVFSADQAQDRARSLIGWGWQDRPHGPVLASDVLGQCTDGDPSRPDFGRYGPYGGPTDHGFFFYAFNAGRYQTLAGMAAHPGLGKLAVPDYWNHRVLLFDLKPDGSPASRRAGTLIGQNRLDVMEIGQGADRLHYPSACAFDPSGRLLFVADEYNHRVLQFEVSSPARAVRVYGQQDFQSWGPNGTAGQLVWDSTRPDQRGPLPEKRPDARGLFLPRGVACDGRRLFVSDCDNHRVLVFRVDGADNGPQAVAVLGQADFHGRQPNRGGPARPNTLLFPSGLAIDPDAKTLLVADSMNHRVLAFKLAESLQNGAEADAVLPLPGSGDPPRPSQPQRREVVGAVDVAIGAGGRVFVSERAKRRVLVYRLSDILAGRSEPLAAVGKLEMSTDLKQTKPGYTGPTGLAIAGDFLYVAEPRGNRVLCFNAADPERRAVDCLGQFYGNDLTRPDYHKYGPNNGPDPFGFDFADGTPAMSVTEDGHWLLAADTIGGRLLFFPLAPDGLPVDRSARLALGVPTLTARANNYGAERFNRPSHSVLTADGRLFASDFQGSRILYFELPNFAESVGSGALQPPRPYVPPTGRKPGHRESFEFYSVESGRPARHVLGQVDFHTGLRGVASQRQMGKEISGLNYDRERGWLFIGEKLNHRVLIVDVSRNVETFMPALAVLGQTDFDANTPYAGHGEEWHPAGIMEPSGLAYDHLTKILYVASGPNQQEREILGFDLSGDLTNGMQPVVRIGGPHATVHSDLPFVDRPLAIDVERRRLWSGLFALDLSGGIESAVPLVGWFGLGPHPSAASLQDYHTAELPNLLGYSVGFCHRFGGGVNQTAVNPRTGTVYVADNARYRILCFQPVFQPRRTPIAATIGQSIVDYTGTGGLAPLGFEIMSGTLPQGLRLDPDTGLIQGVATDREGTYALKVRVTTPLGRTEGGLTIELRQPEQPRNAPDLNSS